MSTYIGVALLLGIPFAIFIAASWRQEERDRDRRNNRPPGSGDQPDSYWGGMGRPGR